MTCVRDRSIISSSANALFSADQSAGGLAAALRANAYLIVFGGWLLLAVVRNSRAVVTRW
jgi:hypothetical protein